MAKPVTPKPKPKKAKAPARKKANRKAGQPKRGPLPWEPTADERRLVEHCVAIGMRQEEVALVLEKSVDTLARHCRKELDSGSLKANAKVGAKLFDKAMKGDSACIIFWAKTRMGFRETSRHEHTGANGAPIETLNYDLSKLSEKELDQLERLRNLITVAGSDQGGEGPASSGGRAGPP